MTINLNSPEFDLKSQAVGTLDNPYFLVVLVEFTR